MAHDSQRAGQSSNRMDLVRTIVFRCGQRVGRWRNRALAVAARSPVMTLFGATSLAAAAPAWAYGILSGLLERYLNW